MKPLIDQQPSAPECPFCGGLGVLLSTLDIPKYAKVWVQCNDCGAQGPRFPHYDRDKLGSDKAWAAWSNAAVAKLREETSAGEWTAETVEKLYLSQPDSLQDFYELVANTVNAATAKLREELDSETERRVNYEAYIRDASVAIFGSKYGSTGDEAARSPQGTKEFLADVQQKLAHQQPSATTPEVEKLARDFAKDICAVLGFKDWETRSESIMPFMRAFLAQARAPLVELTGQLAVLKKEHDDNVAVLKDYAGTIQNLGGRSQQLRAQLAAAKEVLKDLSEFCSGRTIDDVMARARDFLSTLNPPPSRGGLHYIPQ